MSEKTNSTANRGKQMNTDQTAAIKVLERRRDEILMRIQDKDRSANVFKPEADAIQLALDRIREADEMLEAATEIHGAIQKDGEYVGFALRYGRYRDDDYVWAVDIENRQVEGWFDSALEAFAKTKQEVGDVKP